MLGRCRLATIASLDRENIMNDRVGRIAPKIAIVQGAPSAVVQELFRSFAERWRPSVRLAGVLAEDHGLPDRACTAGYLRSLVDGARYPIFQDLGRNSGCHLSGDGAVVAAAAVRGDIAAGCDLVMLSKFGKLEADGGGLRDAFGAAIEAGVPVLTSVSPAYTARWEAFAAPLFTVLPPDAAQVDAWWRSVCPPSHRPSSEQAAAYL
jgi:Protein of unknown function (DUF2478)